MNLPQTLFSRTALTLASAFLLLLFINAAIFGYFVMTPTARQASEDAAALLVLSAQTWAELPPQTRTDFEYELDFSHGITLTLAEDKLTQQQSSFPQLDLLKQALEERLGSPLVLTESLETPDWFEVDLPIAGRNLRMSFPRERFAPDAPFALFWLVLAAALVTLATTLLLVRHLTHPLKRLSDATISFGRGETPEPLQPTGPQELKILTRSFNRMTTQLKELLSNRTTLLAGISHDLRTPIARLSLALEMLPQDSDATLISSMRKDLKEMDELIARTLLLARNMDDVNIETDEINIAELIDGIVSEFHNSPVTINWQPDENCILDINTVAFRRVVTNLIENAIRYGGDKLTVRYQCSNRATSIEVLDNGPGIPEEQLKTVFQPFYRLEASRNTATGGSGLGLAIVQQLCHANGWQITLKNRKNGGLQALVNIPVQA